jgi:hypothetical protein
MPELLMVVAFILLLAALGAVGDWWDGRERRDATRRNPRRDR